jgi:hypothetical protein
MSIFEEFEELILIISSIERSEKSIHDARIKLYKLVDEGSYTTKRFIYKMYLENDDEKIINLIKILINPGYKSNDFELCKDICNILSQTIK